MIDFKKIDFKKVSMPKLIGLLFLGLVTLVVVLWLLSFALRAATGLGSSTSGFSNDSYIGTQAPSISPAYDRDDSYSEESYSSKITSLIPPHPEDGNSVGNDAEDFEVTEYFGTIKTRKLNRVCNAIESLKAEDFIIFERANAYEHGCDYVFKVENEKADEVLAAIKNLKPEIFTESTYTIKKTIDSYTSQTEILMNRLESIEEVLDDAQYSYDQIAVIATQNQDAESLAKIINDKMNLITRLTNERVNIKAQIDRINKSKADQLDRINYTFFSISAYESLIIDTKAIKESWSNEMKKFVRELNSVMQGLTINLLKYLLIFVQIVIFLGVALFVLKYGWRVAKVLWRK